MIADIIKKEILGHLLDSKFLFTFIVSSVLILLSVYIGMRNYATDKKDYLAGVAEAGRTLDERLSGAGASIREGGPGGIDITGMREFAGDAIKIFRQTSSLEAVVRGVGDASGRVSGVNNRMENRPAESKYESNLFLAIFSAFDLLFVVKMVLSLFALLFAYDAVSGEKEKGTLSLALANSVPRSRMILGKAIGGYVSLILPILVPLFIGTLLMSLNSDMGLGGDDGEDWTRLFLLYGMFLLYLSVFFALGLFVSSLTARSSTSFLALLFVWVVLVLIIPKVAPAAAGWIRPAPFAHETLSEKTRAVPQIMQEIDTNSLRDLYSESSGRRPVRPTTMDGYRDPVYQADLRRWNEEVNKLTSELGQKYETLLADAYTNIDREYRLRQDAQRRLAKNLSRVSPASGLTFGGMVLARTGTEEYNRFLGATRDYRNVYSDWLVRNNLRNAFGQFSPTARLTAADMPQFQFEPESLGESLARTLPDFALMAAMTVIFLAGAFFAFLRYDVR